MHSIYSKTHSYVNRLVDCGLIIMQRSISTYLSAFAIEFFIENVILQEVSKRLFTNSVC